jgi:hypothetical protein
MMNGAFCGTQTFFIFFNRRWTEFFFNFNGSATFQSRWSGEEINALYTAAQHTAGRTNSSIDLVCTNLEIKRNYRISQVCGLDILC